MKKLVLLFILLSTSVNADFNNAINSYQNGEFESAYNQFLAMAETGEKRSQFNLGIMYFYGQHVTKDLNQAYAWLKLATESETSKQSEIEAFELVRAKIKDIKKADELYKSIANKYSTQVLVEKLYPELVKTVNNADFHATPIKIINPRYPRNASYAGKQGWVRYKFDIDKLGVPRNIQLVESFPEDVFVKESRKVIPKWRFKPALDANNEPKEQKNLSYKMEFRLSKTQNLEIKKHHYNDQMEKALAGDPIAQFNIGYYEKKLHTSKGKENPNEWFLKSAIQGHPIAQLELGESLIFGQGCKQDKAKGIEWLTRAAHTGQSDARQLLASLATRVKTLESQKQALVYIKDVDNLNINTQLSIAWMLATSPFKEIVNPDKAINIVDSISSKYFTDDITLYEIQAAAYASTGDFDEAIDLQEEALDEAKDRDADLETINFRLASYRNKQKWF